MYIYIYIYIHALHAYKPYIYIYTLVYSSYIEHESSRHSALIPCKVGETKSIVESAVQTAFDSRSRKATNTSTKHDSRNGVCELKTF